MKYHALKNSGLKVPKSPEASACVSLLATFAWRTRRGLHGSRPSCSCGDDASVHARMFRRPNVPTCRTGSTSQSKPAAPRVLPRCAKRVAYC
jgi:hypothetical protein